MRRLGSIGRAAFAASVVLGASSVTHASLAEGTQDSQHMQDPQDNQGMHDTQAAPDTTVAQAVTALLSVQKIDKTNRMLTLKTSDGQTFDAKAGPDVDLKRIHAGDSVEATYYEEIAIAINASGKTATKSTTTTVQREGVTAKQATLTARVVSVDADKKTVTLRDPQGKMHMVKVQDPDVQAKLDRIKAGDTVDVTYTQAIAMSVQPAQQEKK